jgi:hypothetical protein
MAISLSNEFDSDVEFFNEYDDNAVEVSLLPSSNIPRRLKVYKSRYDPFACLEDDDFRKKYRLSKPVVRRVIDMISGDLGASHETRGGKISPELQVLACLRYWGRGEVRTILHNLFIVGLFHE